MHEAQPLAAEVELRRIEHLGEDIRDHLFTGAVLYVDVAVLL